MSETPHDSLFRFTFGQPTNAAALIRSNLPERVAARIDWRSLRLENGSYVDEDAKWLHCDLVFSARIGRRPALIYVLLEHQSSPDPLMPLRMLRYLTRVWSAWLDKNKGAKKITAIIPLVVYHGDTEWRAPTRLSDVLDLLPNARSDLGPHLPDLQILLDDLTRQAPNLRKRRLPAAALLTALSLVGFPKRDAFLVLANLLDLIRELPVHADGRATLAAVLCYVFEVTSPEPDPQRLQAFLAREIGPVPSEVAMSAADKLRQQGKIEGRAEGRAEGRVEGRAATLLKLLTLKFGKPSTGTRKRIEAASIDELDRIAERILSATTVRQVFTEAPTRHVKPRARKK